MKRALILITTLVITIATISVAAAQTRAPIIPPTTDDGVDIALPIPDSSLSAELYFGGVLIPTIARTVIAIAGGLALLFVIIGAVQILTAYGSEEKITQGRKTITFALIGMLIAILAFAIVTIIGNIQLE